MSTDTLLVSWSLTAFFPGQPGKAGTRKGYRLAQQQQQQQHRLFMLKAEVST